MKDRVFTVERHVPYAFGEVHGVFSTYEKAKDYLNKVQISAREGYEIVEYAIDELEK